MPVIAVTITGKEISAALETLPLGLGIFTSRSLRVVSRRMIGGWITGTKAM